MKKNKKSIERTGDVTASHRVEYLGLRMAAFLLRCLPLGWASGLMGKIWRVAAPLTYRHERVMRNLEIGFPGLTKAARRKIAAEQWENLGRTFGESFLIDRLIADDSRFDNNIPDEIGNRFRGGGTGAVITGMHSANWEVAGRPISEFFPVIGLYQRLSNPLSDTYVVGLRTQVFGGGMLSKSRETPKRIMEWVRDGNAVAMLADLREARGVAVQFFGQETTANPFPAMVARRLGVPLIVGRAIRLPGVRFRIEAVEIPVPQTEDAAIDVQVATQAIQKQFERWIRERPGEWMWVNDRWRATQGRSRPRRRPLDFMRQKPN
ncbi:lysophospholipid acyltransferase family protein [Faunimonas pinastri]|uniref:lysophospholipid acyltransferase family protein n=1 Tax=Faunimonas pinastri TaxID=1855383 RepID=UPI00115F8CEE|nr:lauroyl acyltransferase [Faunimonas pinastri]